MQKRLFAVLAAAILSVGLVLVCIRYYHFVTQTIYNESTTHLTEIYHQANKSLHNLVGRNWSTLHMWVPYLRDAQSDEQIEQYVARIQEESQFTDFYFISREGNYLTVDGKSGYMNLKNLLPDLILRKKDVVVNSVVPGSPQIMVFAVPAEHGTYRGFDYDAIAISFINSDLVETLKISAFDGQSISYVIHPDGRVIVNNNNGQFRDIYNFLAMLQNDSDLSAAEISALQQDFEQHRSGASTFRIGRESYYLIYESVEFDDWTVLGVVPASVVNASMSNLQSSTLVLVAGVVAALAAALIVFLFHRYRRSISAKDTEILYREELFSVLSSNVDDIFAMLDAETYAVEYISPNIERLAGIAEADARRNIRVVDQLVQDTSEGLLLDQLPAIQPGEQAEWERQYIHCKTGETRWFHAIALCREIRGGRKYILVLSDRTKEKKINQDLEEAVSAARSANRAKSTFLSNMSHDIRTPMNAIIGFATLAASTAENPKTRDYLAKILASSSHLLSLINDVLDMSRIESGKIQLEEQEVNLPDVLRDIKTIIGGQTRDKQLRLYMDVSDVSDENVFCDKTRLNQVLLNLLSNAIKFTPSGGSVSVQVRQTGRVSDGSGLYEIRVRDTGIGMSREFADRIFEPFERERTSTVSRIQGTGLGMSITKNIIDMMGGSIEVHTRQGEGTEFIIRLSLRLQPVSSAPEAAPEWQNWRVLAADGDSHAADGTLRLLRRAGMRPEQASSGKELLRLARQALDSGDPFRVFILDEQLPDGGIETVRRIRALCGPAPAVLLTVYDSVELEQEARAAGVTAFCSKPLFRSELRDCLLHSSGCQESMSEVSPPEPQESARFEGKHLLLTEDNELNREIAMEILSDYGFRIDTAENGAQAVEKISASQPGDYDLILMDVQMPVMNGYEATRRIRALENPALAGIPILAMTANAFDEDRRAALDCGMNGFLSKPINIDDMIHVLTGLFDRR